MNKNIMRILNYTPRKIIISPSSISRRLFTTSNIVRKFAPTSIASLPSDPDAKGRLSGGKIIGVEAALAHSKGERQARRDIFEEYSLKNQTIVVTGGNGGLGLEITQSIGEAEASTIHVFDKTKEPSESFKAVQGYLKDLGTNLYYHSLDVTEQKAVWDKCDQIGKINGLVAAAAILDGYHCQEYPSDAFENIYKVNVGGVFYTAQGVARQMLKYNNGGSIIIIASLSGSITNRYHDWVGYNSSKCALLQVARSMAAELGPSNIRVNTLSPGHIKTEMTTSLFTTPGLEERWSNSNPLGRLGLMHELRGSCVYMLSSASSYMTGTDVKVTGGYETW